eukprot:2756370-Rhodomonas_salina.1
MALSSARRTRWELVFAETNDPHHHGAIVFAETNDPHHHGAHHCSVGGDLSSLRAEAAVMDLLLDHTDKSVKLVVFTDSLALMRLLDGCDRADFFPLPELQQHSDIMDKLSGKLNARSGETVIVKIKSHTDVPLNELADGEANKGCTSARVRFSPDSVSGKGLLVPVTAAGVPLTSFATAVVNATVAREMDVIRSWSSLSTESFVREGKGQQHLTSYRKSLPDRQARPMLQLFGGVFPCAMSMKRIGKSDTDECPLCHKKESPSHILCGCKELLEIVTASHNKIWLRLFEFLRSHLSR